MTYGSLYRTYCLLTVICQTFTEGYVLKMMMRLFEGNQQSSTGWNCVIYTNPMTTGDKIVVAAAAVIAVVLIVSTIIIGKRNIDDWEPTKISDVLLLFLLCMPVSCAVLFIVPGLYEIIPLF